MDLGPICLQGDGGESHLTPPFPLRQKGHPNGSRIPPRLQDDASSAASHAVTPKGQACGRRQEVPQGGRGGGRREATCVAPAWNVVRLGIELDPERWLESDRRGKGVGSVHPRSLSEFRRQISDNNNGCRNNSVVLHTGLATEDTYTAGCIHAYLRPSASASADWLLPLHCDHRNQMETGASTPADEDRGRGAESGPGVTQSVTDGPGLKPSAPAPRLFPRSL